MMIYLQKRVIDQNGRSPSSTENSKIRCGMTAHVVVQVKNNQPKLYQAVQSQFQSLFDAQKEKIVVE
ncbi:hypothetical protein, partial [Aeromonas caviae]